MKTKDMIAENQALQKQLNKENEAYYSDLVVYVRLKSFFKSEAATEDVLLTILQDLLSAQGDGVSAEEYFGDNPKAIADDLLKEFPTKLRYGLKLVGWAMLCTLFVNLFPNFLSPDRPIDFGTLALDSLCLGLGVLFFLYLVSTLIYSKKSHKIAMFLAIIFVLGGAVEISRIHTPFVVYLSNYVGIALILIVLAVLSFAYFSEKDKGDWSLFIPIVLTFCGIGILIRIPALQNYFISDAGKGTMVICVIAALVVTYGLLFLYTRKLKKD